MRIKIQREISCNQFASKSGVYCVVEEIPCFEQNVRFCSTNTKNKIGSTGTSASCKKLALSARTQDARMSRQWAGGRQTASLALSTQMFFWTKNLQRPEPSSDFNRETY